MQDGEGALEARAAPPGTSTAPTATIGSNRWRVDDRRKAPKGGLVNAALGVNRLRRDIYGTSSRYGPPPQWHAHYGTPTTGHRLGVAMTFFRP